MANTLKVKFNSLPAVGNSITFAASVPGFGTSLTETFGNGLGQIVIGADIYDTAINYRNHMNGIAGWSATLDNAELNVVLITSTTSPTGYTITSAFTSPVGTNFAALSLLSAPVTTGNGDTVNIKVDTLDRALKFLSTEFMDLGGKNNQVAYRNPRYLNFAGQNSTAPAIGPNAKVVICKNASSNGNYIGSYLSGEEGGVTPTGTTPGWEWWSRSFLIYDTTVGDAQTVLNNVILDTNQINQNNSTCAWYPGDNALSNSAPPSINGTCNVQIETPIGSLDEYTYVGVFTGSDENGLLISESTTTTTQVISIPGSTYTGTMTLDAPTDYGFFGNSQVALTSADVDGTPYNNISITSVTFSGTVTNGLYSSVTITYEDSTFGGSGAVKTLFLQGEVFLIYQPSWIVNRLDQEFLGRFQLWFKPTLPSAYSTLPDVANIWFNNNAVPPGINADPLPIEDLALQNGRYEFDDNVARQGYFKLNISNIATASGPTIYFADFYNVEYDNDPLGQQVFKFSIDLTGNFTPSTLGGESDQLALLNGVHVILNAEETCPDPEEFIMITETLSKKAKDLVKGEKVYTQHEHTKEWGLFDIEEIKFAEALKNRVKFTDGTDVIVSVTHKFLTENDEWKRCLALSPGDVLQGQNENKTVSAIERLEKGPIVKMEIKDAHTYVVAGLISHNKLPD